MTAREYTDAADEALRAAHAEPMGLEEYVETCRSNPIHAAHAAKYLLAAIERAGTRTVVEEGTELRRYRFFDDPHNDGEHAVLGNTETLNDFVDDLRTVAADRGKGEKLVWFDGPTATGKSELKRCLVNGLREFSKTREGRRFTLEWNLAGAGEDRGLTYGSDDADEDDWHASPVQTHPLSVFPEDVAAGIEADVNRTIDDGVPVSVEADLDPFSREAFETLVERHRREGSDAPFSAATDARHLRVTNYVVDEGRGIGVLHAEDDGTPKERLVGSWMPGMLRELDSRGRKDPRAFSYDGVLSQGNGLLTVVEDASQHADLLRKLLNVPDEGRVKLDRGIGMDVDTQLVVLSNPDLEADLEQYSEREGRDPLKALKRRLDRHEFRYLTSLALETQLVRRELTDETAVWTGDEEATHERIRQPLHVAVREGTDGVREREFAPHAVAAAATYAVVTRLDTEDLPPGLDLIDKALLLDRGYHQAGDERTDADEFDLDGADGVHGIPVTYTRDVMADLLHEDTERRHPDLAVEDVITPDDILDAMADRLGDAPVFSSREVDEFEGRVGLVRRHVRERQEADVLDAVLAGKGVDEETVAEYVEHVYAWANDDQVETDRGPVDPDPLVMKLFEVEHLGRFEETDYSGEHASGQVEEFRHETVIAGLNRYAWQHRDEGFAVDSVDLTELPVVREVLETHSWDDVERLFPDFDPAQWEDPPADTETERVKDDAIAELTDAGYSRASAELASRAVMREVDDRWD